MPQAKVLPIAAASMQSVQTKVAAMQDTQWIQYRWCMHSKGDSRNRYSMPAGNAERLQTQTGVLLDMPAI